MQAAFFGLSTGQVLEPDISDMVAMDYNDGIVKGFVGYKYLIKLRLLLRHKIV